MKKLTRRKYLAASAGFLAAGAAGTRAALALDPVRQGYQTNIWGMPTYYLLKSGLLEKHGIKFEEFAVPSGNLTMQQMVARQVDLGTYAGQSFIIGHDKGGLVAIAQIETVGKTAQVVTRKDLNLSKVEQLKGLKVANQSGSSIGNIFTDIIAPKAGLKKGDFKDNPAKVSDVIYSFFTSKGYNISRESFAKALARVEVDPSFPSDLVPSLQRDAEVLLREKKISAIPDWKKALRPDLWAKASA